MKKNVVVLTVIIAEILSIVKLRRYNRKTKELAEKSKKILLYYRILNMWLEMRQKGICAAEYLQRKGIKRVAIYGMKELGERFYEELKHSEIEVVCVIDQNPELVLGDFWVISPEDPIPETDAVIVTAEYYGEQIKEVLKGKVSCPVYLLSSVLGNSFGRQFAG